MGGVRTEGQQGSLSIPHQPRGGLGAGSWVGLSWEETFWGQCPSLQVCPGTVLGAWWMHRPPSFHTHALLPRLRHLLLAAEAPRTGPRLSAVRCCPAAGSCPSWAPTSSGHPGRSSSLCAPMSPTASTPACLSLRGVCGPSLGRAPAPGTFAPTGEVGPVGLCLWDAVRDA